MDYILLLKALIMGIVQGVTEFLPISSTGHLILAGALLDFVGEKAQVFEIIIQGASILAVCWEYRSRLFQTVTGITHDRKAQRLTINLIIAFIPLAVLGLIFRKWIQSNLFNPVTVAIALIVGGIIIFWAEKRQHTVRIQTIDDIKPADAVKLGICQAAALIPGTSRSGATIIGGLFVGLSRPAATEFSFFLAIPTLILATLYQLYAARDLLTFDDAGFFAAGCIASFVSAFIAIRGLLRYIRTHDFKIFGYYRIIFGLIVLATMGWIDWYA